MKYFIKFILALTIVLTSCKNEIESKKELNTRVIPFTEVGNQMRNEAAAKNAVPVNQNQNSISTTTSAPTGKGLNPAHGQTGHRCDIPVGAPLNLPPTQAKANSNTAKNAPTMTLTPNDNQASTSTPQTTTPEGMNPPHGQTGHRCDIAVGAVLPKE